MDQGGIVTQSSLHESGKSVALLQGEKPARTNRIEAVLHLVASGTIIATVLAFSGFCLLKSADVFLKGPPYTNPESGYYASHWIGGLLYIFCLPTAVTGLFVLVVNTLKVRPAWRSAILSVAAAVSLGAGMTALAVWGAFWDSAELWGNGSGFVITTGAGLFVLCLLLSMAFLEAQTKVIAAVAAEASDQQIVIAFLLVGLPVCFILAFLMPGLYNKFSQDYGHFFSTSEASLESRDGIKFQFGHIWAALYWDVFIYYAFLYLLCIAAVASKCSPSLYALLHKPMKLPYYGVLLVGELLLWLWFGALLVLWIWFWSEHKWEGVSTQGTDRSGKFLSTVEQWARIMGQVSNLVMSLLVLPTSRNSVWSKILGVPWEAMVAAHRVLGYLLLVTTFVHQALFWKVWADQADGTPAGTGKGQLAESGAIFAVPMTFHADNWTIPTIIIVQWCTLICMGIFAFHKIRRSNFELFYYTHHIFLVLYIAALWHASSLWYTLSGGLALYALDRLLRFSRGCAVANVSLLTVNGDVTELVIDKLDNAVPHFEMGQYAFVNIPEISLLQWHPFTIASAPHEQLLRFNIKNMGPGTWTAALHTLGSIGGPMPIVNIDAAYGLPLELHRYKRIVLVLGGIGVTPGLSILSEIHELAKTEATPSVHFVWSIRDGRMLDICGPRLEEICQDPSFEISVHLTVQGDKSEEALHHHAGLITSTQRPDYKEVLNSSLTVARPEDTLVFACGPAALINSASVATFSAGMNFHSETFEL